MAAQKFPLTAGCLPGLPAFGKSSPDQRGSVSAHPQNTYAAFAHCCPPSGHLLAAISLARVVLMRSLKIGSSGSDLRGHGRSNWGTPVLRTVSCITGRMV